MKWIVDDYAGGCTDLRLHHLQSDRALLPPVFYLLLLVSLPRVQELADCRFAWTVAKHVKSNAIVYAKGGSTAGVGAGQMNRLESARIAAWKAKDAAEKVRNNRLAAFNGQLLIGELSVRGGSRVNHQCLGITDVCNMAMQLQCLYKLLTSFAATLDFECDH